MPPILLFQDLQNIPYADALQRQHEAHDQVLRWRAEAEEPDTDPSSAPPPLGIILLLEHDPPVITITRRPTAQQNLIASPELLQQHNIQTHHTDRGGDITYHGPGQLIAYPILDLRRLKLNLHAYIRLLEQAAIDTCHHFNLTATRDPAATGVWITSTSGHTTDSPPASPSSRHPDGAKICAIGVRVRRWVSLHGLALNISTNLDHFELINPCGLTGRPVTSMTAELPPGTAPPMTDAKHALQQSLQRLITPLT